MGDGREGRGGGVLSIVYYHYDGVSAAIFVAFLVADWLASAGEAILSQCKALYFSACISFSGTCHTSKTSWKT